MPSVEHRSENFVYPAVRNRIDRDNITISKTVATLSPLAVHEVLARIPIEATDNKTPYWHNSYFSGGDARYACAFAAHLKPKTILEVGAGNSTKFFRYAINNFGLSTRLCCVDPAPREEITTVADEVINESVLQVNINIFDSLRENDILFWDGSHVVLNGSDVVRLFLEIIPRLHSGVVVHIHDIVLPFDYNDVFSNRGYAEQYMLATYLLNAPDVEILLPLYYLHRTARVQHAGVSFWMRVRSRKSAE